MEARTARLGLARVSVVRGEGPAAGTACIDDYIRTLEPVADYLTRFSGLARVLLGLGLNGPAAHPAAGSGAFIKRQGLARHIYGNPTILMCLQPHPGYKSVSRASSHPHGMLQVPVAEQVS